MNNFSKLRAFCASLFVSTSFGLNAQAQSTQVATLSHNGTLTAYYGVDALKEAYKAAEANDVITLSAGEFNGDEFFYRKPVTVRGAGFEANAEDNRMRTTLKTELALGSSDKADYDDDDQLINHKRPVFNIEGLHINGVLLCRSSDVNITKCYISNIYGSNAGQYPTNPHLQLTIVNSIIGKAESYYVPTTLFATNSIMHNMTISGGTFQNCVFPNFYPTNSSYNNCILIDGRTIHNVPDRFQAESTATNCVACGPNFHKKYWEQVPASNTSNTVVQDYSIFKTFNGTFHEGSSFELTDEAKAKYPNLGIYAGSVPYNTTPNNPQITKFVVDNKTAADGTLKVDIEVKTAK